MGGIRGAPGTGVAFWSVQGDISIAYAAILYGMPGTRNP
jgi:hypothetical protein